jgi:hypothetical protein
MRIANAGLNLDYSWMEGVILSVTWAAVHP